MSLQGSDGDNHAMETQQGVSNIKSNNFQVQAGTLRGECSYLFVYIRSLSLTVLSSPSL